MASSLIRKPNHAKEPNRWLLLYGLLSFLYRWFVVGAILYGVYVLSSHWEVREIGLGVIAFLVATLMVGRMRSKGRQFSGAAFGELRWRRATLTTMVAGSLLAFVFFVPIPRSVYSEFEVSLKDPTPIFAPVDGQLVFVASPYQSVAKGETIARLENDKLKQKVQQQKFKLARAANELAQLNARVNEGPFVASQLEIARKNVESIKSGLKAFESELNRANVVAPASGVVYPVDEQVQQGVTGSEIWRIRLDESRNVNCTVGSGDRLMTLGNPDDKRVTLFVSERKMDFVTIGQTVRLCFDRVPGEVYAGKVGEIFEDEIQTDASIYDRRVEADKDNLAAEKSFRVTVEMETIPETAVAGSVGRAKIAVAKQTIAGRIFRTLQTAMNTRL